MAAWLLGSALLGLDIAELGMLQGENLRSMGLLSRPRKLLFLHAKWDILCKTSTDCLSPGP